MNQHKPTSNRSKAEQVYALLLHLYPRAHRQEFGPLMLQSFKDHYSDTQATQGGVGITFWLEVLTDEAISVLREQVSSLLGGITMQALWKQQGVIFGLLLGILAIGPIIWTNVLFPSFESDSEYGSTYAIVYGLIFLFFAVVGFLASRKSTRILSGTWAGAMTALLGIGIIMMTYFVVDNLFLDIVGKQVDKLAGFHQSHFQTMRDYVNNGLLWGTITVLPVMAVVGAVCGTIGASVSKLLSFARL